MFLLRREDVDLVLAGLNLMADAACSLDQEEEAERAHALFTDIANWRDGEYEEGGDAWLSNSQ